METTKITDDQLRAALFSDLVARLEAAAATDPTIVVKDRSDAAFSLSRHGNYLVVHQSSGRCVMAERPALLRPEPNVGAAATAEGRVNSSGPFASIASPGPVSSVFMVSRTAGKRRFSAIDLFAGQRFRVAADGRAVCGRPERQNPREARDECARIYRGFLR
jgi:hypothetical protein